jgi:hypothetical protein
MYQIHSDPEEELLVLQEEFTNCPKHGTLIELFTDCPDCLEDEFYSDQTPYEELCDEVDYQQYLIDKGIVS